MLSSRNGGWTSARSRTSLGACSSFSAIRTATAGPCSKFLLRRRRHKLTTPGSLGAYPSAYSPECVEDKFCELRLYGVLRSSRRGASGPTPTTSPTSYPASRRRRGGRGPALRPRSGRLGPLLRGEHHVVLRAAEGVVELFGLPSGYGVGHVVARCSASSRSASARWFSIFCACSAR